MFGVQSLPCSNAVRELEFSSLQFMCCEQAFRMRSVIVIFKGEVSGEQKCPGGQMDVRGGDKCPTFAAAGEAAAAAAFQSTICRVPSRWPARSCRESDAANDAAAAASDDDSICSVHPRSSHQDSGMSVFNTTQSNPTWTQPNPPTYTENRVYYVERVAHGVVHGSILCDPIQPNPLQVEKIWTQRDPTQYN